jgi:hypothetical protein
VSDANGAAKTREELLIEAVIDWVADRAPNNPGDAALMKAIWTYHGDVSAPCEDCDGDCGEPCAPCTVKQAHAMLDKFADDWRRRQGWTTVAAAPEPALDAI